VDTSLGTIGIPAEGGLTLPANLLMPRNPCGLILFGHGAGSGRYSLRNRFVAGTLNAAGFATLLVDLLTQEENDNPAARTDLSLVISRLTSATRWIIDHPDLNEIPLGYFGPRIGAPAALWCAAQFSDRVKAVVARGGKADLAGEALERVRCPVLLLAGSKDAPVVDSNIYAFRHLLNAAPRRSIVIPGASHLFEEENALERVALLTRSWFQAYVKTASPRAVRLVEA
jgi:pimeloyl-ACP methyl ester carboxylesterase